MGETEISWTHRPGTVGRSWNVAQGCSRISEGCRHCYAERIAARFAAKGWSKGLIDLRTRRWNGVVRLAAHRLHEPLAWTKPSTVFANSMSDLFHDGFTNEQIAAVYGVMLAAKRHTFQVLTKRSGRRRDWYRWVAAQAHIKGWREACFLLSVGARALEDAGQTVWSSHLYEMSRDRHAWPAPNIWEGASVEDQDAADERIPPLVETPAAVRFLSLEPLLGPVDLHAIQSPDADPGLHFSALQRHHDDCFHEMSDHSHPIDWIIVGCESGPGARECAVPWMRALRDQALGAGRAFFLKQAKAATTLGNNMTDGAALVTLGKRSHAKSGGVIELPYLDGVQHAAFPAATAT